MVPVLIEALRKYGIRRRSNAGSFARGAHQRKMEFRGSWGPFGHLVKEASFSSAQDHFFRAPEAVVDLGFDLRAFRAATVPCIVKFRASEPREDVPALALFYAYLAIWGHPADWDCSTTWSGEGTAVPPEDILRIEFLDPALFAVEEDE